jgi:short-subunit dehydrogenase
MSVPLKPVKDQVIVITGASSGIGMATALEAAAQGARLMLSSRNEAALHEVCTQIKAEGGTAHYFVADVGSREQIEELAQATLAIYGGFDTWVNNAGVGIWGKLDEVSDEDNRRLFETNFWGVVYGSLAAAEHLKQRGGAIINIGSVESDMVLPLQGVYSASKHAVKAFTEVLRIELEAEDAPVSVSLVKPAGIGTPMPQHMKNYMDVEGTWAPPVYEPREAALAILRCAAHPVRDMRVGSASRSFALLEKTMPRVLDKIDEKFMFKAQRIEEHPAIAGDDNLHQAGPDGEVKGWFPTRTVRSSLYNRMVLNPGVTAGASFAAMLALVALVLSRNS